jgi:hypothetical protein
VRCPPAVITPAFRPALVALVALVALPAACGDTTLDVFDSDRGLIAHWELDESDPADLVLDSSGHGHDGMPSANPPTPSPSVPPVRFPDARSRAFNGHDQLIEFPNATDLNFSGIMTLSAWINPIAIDDYRYIVAHGFHYLPDTEVTLRIAHGGRYEISGWDSVDHMAGLAVPASDVGTWVHLCGVYDGSAYILYRNGVQVSATPDAFAPPPVDSPWSIGARASSDPVAPARFFAGLIDDVRIYSRALSPAEVMALARR